MLAMLVNLWKRLYFYKVSVWLVSHGVWASIASREEIAEQEGSQPGAIESYTASEVDVGEIE